MDEYTALKLSDKLLGKVIGGWHIEKYTNHGKSAVVFYASKETQKAALKVFDPEIVERYGRDKQLKRIDRELSLIGKKHPNLISVYDGGEDKDYLYIAMEYFDGKNLAEELKNIPMNQIRTLISQIAHAAKFLEDQSFAHRDIKPENIGISPDMQAAKLLDFGVIRPFDLSNVTDEGDQLYFVGTLQYSPPELLFREEEQSVEAWRAITFYQLGAVLHDLLMQKQLFEKFKNPYSRLVIAVEREIPMVENPKADSDLRLLAQNCLAKTASNRLDTVKWEDFSQPKSTDSLDLARKRIAQRRVAADQTAKGEGNIEDLHNTQLFMLKTIIFSSVVNIFKAEGFPPYKILEIDKKYIYSLRVLIEPSAKDDLDNYFAIYFQGEVIDPKANFHELKSWAGVGFTSEAVPAIPENINTFRTIKGALIEQDIRTFVQECLLFSYAEALESNTKELNKFNWLQIGSEI